MQMKKLLIQAIIMNIFCNSFILLPLLLFIYLFKGENILTQKNKDTDKMVECKLILAQITFNKLYYVSLVTTTPSSLQMLHDDRSHLTAYY